MSPSRIHRTRLKGSRLPENTVCVTRGTKWGNPFEITANRTQSEAVRFFEESLLEGQFRFTVADVRRELAGKNLACWCKPGTPCHAEVLLRIANERNPLPVEMLIDPDKRRTCSVAEHEAFRKSLEPQPEGDEL